MKIIKIKNGWYYKTRVDISNYILTKLIGKKLEVGEAIPNKYLWVSWLLFPVRCFNLTRTIKFRFGFDFIMIDNIKVSKEVLEIFCIMKDYRYTIEKDNYGMVYVERQERNYKTG